MSPPQKAAPQPAQHPYSPYQNAGSPTSQYGPPPAKRQRTSPDPRSPPNGVPNTNPYPPQQHVGQFGNPYTQSPVQSPYSPQYGPSSQNSFNTPQPYPYQSLPWQQSQPQTPVQTPQPQQMRHTSPPSQQSREMMPPPPRPPVKEEKEDKLDLSDSLYGSGINLKDEENYHHQVYSNRHTQNDSFSTVQDSFSSNTMSPNNSFNLLTQGTSFGSHEGNGPLAGTLGQTQSQEDIEIEVRRKREKAAIALAERRQHHLHNQFLLCNNVRKRMDALARDQGVRLGVQGLLIRQETAVMTDAAGTQGIAAAGIGSQAKQDDRPESMVSANSPYESIVSLISLATGERLRGLLDESFELARARRYGDHGRVPPEFADVAKGEGRQIIEEVVPQSITGTEWDKAPDATTPQQTIAFPQNDLTSTLRAIAARDIAAEEARIKKREARRRAAANSAADTPATEEPPANSEIAPEAPKMTKKEQMKQAKESKSTEAALHQTTNQTAAMMTMGKKGKKYSWMTGGAAAMPTNRFAKPGPTASAAASGTSTPTPAVKKEDGGTGSGSDTTAAAPAANEVKVPEWGDWREDGQEGKGIQVRDWVLVLERDGREKKALQRSYTQMGTPSSAGSSIERPRQS